MVRQEVRGDEGCDDVQVEAAGGEGRQEVHGDEGCEDDQVEAAGGGVER